MKTLPRIRRGVVLEETSGPEGRRFTIVDPVQGVSSALDEGSFKLARLLDGGRDEEALLALLSSEGTRIGPAQLRGFLRFLDAYALLENERSRKRLAVAERKDRPLKLLPGAKYSCQASGFCCQSSYRFGPVEDAVRKRVLEEDWSTEIPELQELMGGDREKLFTKEGKHHYLTPIAGRCSFLSPDKLCLIHKKLGYEAKPLICRVFPFVFVGAPDGIYASMRFECRTQHSGRVIGMPLAERLPELEGYVREQASSGDVGSLVFLAPDVPVGYEEYARVERVLLASLDRSGLSPEEHLLGLRDLAVGFVSSLPRHPTEAEIERSLSSLEAGTLPPPARRPDRAVSFREFVGILDALFSGVARVYPGIANRAAEGDWNKVMHDEFILVLLSAIRRAADRAGIEHPSAPVKNLERLDAIAHDTSDPHVGGLYVDFFRNEVFGKYVTHSRGLLPALANIALRYVLVRWNARIRANGRGSDRVSSADVMDSLILVNRLTYVDYLLDTIRKLAPRLIAFFQNLVLDDGPP